MIERWEEEERIARRRGRIAELRLQGIFPYIIADRLREEGFEDTNLGVVYEDLKYLATSWTNAAIFQVAEYKGKMLAELELVMRRGWAENRMSTVLECIKQIRALLGLDAPIKLEYSEKELDSEIEKSLIELSRRNGDDIYRAIVTGKVPGVSEEEEKALPDPRDEPREDPLVSW